MLGLRVHDVGAHQLTREGELAKADPRYPYVRSWGTLRARNYHTVEPGLYFNGILLDKRRADAAGKHVDWSLVDELIPFGGIRIEDNLLVTEQGNINVTRRHLP
jgi:Xaa-Pro dipeptidase